MSLEVLETIRELAEWNIIMHYYKKREKYVSWCNTVCPGMMIGAAFAEMPAGKYLKEGFFPQ